MPVFIDPKVSHKNLYAEAMSQFGNLTMCITPNRSEAEGLSGCEILNGAEFLSGVICNGYNCSHVLVTLGEDGMVLVDKQGTAETILTAAQGVYDVAGAGDTVIGVLALAYASGNSMSDAAHIANAAAGIVVGKAGTAVAHLDELLKTNF